MGEKEGGSGSRDCPPDLSLKQETHWQSAATVLQSGWRAKVERKTVWWGDMTKDTEYPSLTLPQPHHLDPRAHPPQSNLPIPSLGQPPALDPSIPLQSLYMLETTCKKRDIAKKENRKYEFKKHDCENQKCWGDINKLVYTAYSIMVDGQWEQESDISDWTDFCFPLILLFISCWLRRTRRCCRCL